MKRVMTCRLANWCAVFLLASGFVLASAALPRVTHAGSRAQESQFLTVSRSMGFRPASFLNKTSDYSFQLQKDGAWTYRAFGGGDEAYQRSGKLDVAIEEVEALLNRIGFLGLAAPDPSEPRIADLPTMTVERSLGDDRFSREMRPDSAVAMKLHHWIMQEVMNLKRLEVSGLEFSEEGPSAVDQPVVIDAKSKLGDVFAKGAEGLAEAVDFETEKLVVFGWKGSGRDSVIAARMGEGESEEILFEYHPGLTKDLRPHIVVFAIPKGDEFKVAKKDPATFFPNR